MTDEEKKALKVVNNRTERLIEELKIEEEDLIDEPKIAYLVTQIEANKTLVNIIEKQSKEIEELKRVDKSNSQVIANMSTRHFHDREKIRKYEELQDKIKAKIEEYEDKGMTVNLANRSAGKTFQQAVHYEVKKVLQSLLEKE